MKIRTDLSPSRLAPALARLWEAPAAKIRAMELRLMNEGRIPENAWEREFYSIALKCSGAVQALTGEPYLSVDASHHGLLLHSVYHHPNGWDHVPAGRKVPCGESSMWGDYHLREAAVYVQRLIRGVEPPSFFGPGSK